MNNKLNIPKRVKVGFQERKDTYTGKLAYIIASGKKEDPRSWDGWRDKKIPPEEFDNEPTEGFVLNKDVGGTQRSYSWNARREKIRVYDPRNWEFEINVENALFILQECSSIKGKGLEGQFVYAWSGSQIVLLPICSQEYRSSVEFIDLKAQKIEKSDIIEGHTYLTKDKVNVMYLGRHPWFDKRTRYYCGKQLTGQKKHIFLNMDMIVSKDGGVLHNRERISYNVEDGFTKIAKKTSDSPSPDFAAEYEKLFKNTPFVTVPSSFILKPFSFSFEINNQHSAYHYRDYVSVVMDNIYNVGYVKISSDSISWRYPYDINNTTKFDLILTDVVEIKNGEFKQHACKNHIIRQNMTVDEVKAMARTLYIQCENGSEYLVT